MDLILYLHGAVVAGCLNMENMIITYYVHALDSNALDSKGKFSFTL
jgi:hypothetical protein